MCRSVGWLRRSNVIFLLHKNLAHNAHSLVLVSPHFHCMLFFETVRARITGTQNIAKITKSMKMVSASKLRGDAQRLKVADPFSVSVEFKTIVLYHECSTNLMTDSLKNEIYKLSSGFCAERHWFAQAIGGPSYR
jgi:hypothetical protein